MQHFSYVPDQYRELPVAHIGEYFGCWAVLPERLMAAVDRANTLDLVMHVQHARAGGGASVIDYGYAVTPQGTAIISLSGPLMKLLSSLSGGTSTVVARRQIRAATNDDAVKAIALRIDSPGGTVSGTMDLADDVARAASVKPLAAYIEDMGASAAYWIASQAAKVFANAPAVVGSIGIYTVLVDESARAERKGVKVLVVRAGDFKGAGVPGTEISDEQLAETQKVVDALNSHFVQAVAKGRGISNKRASELADGRVHIGAAAQQVGLVDGIQTFDATLEQLAAGEIKPTRRKPAITRASAPAAETKPAKPKSPPAAVAPAVRMPPAATAIEYPAGFAEFACELMKHGHGFEDAQQQWMRQQNVLLAAATAKLAVERASVDSAKRFSALRPGHN